MTQSPSRAPRKPIHVLAVQATVLALLFGSAPLLLPGADRLYPRLFNAHAQVVYNAVMGLVAPGHRVRIDTIETDDADRRDTRMVGYGPRSVEREWRQFHRIYTRGWWPTAFVMGLILATPLPWRRRCVALGLGVLIADGLILIRVGVMVFVNFAVAEQVGSADWQGVRSVAEESFRSWVPPLVIVLLSWVAVARPTSTIDATAARRLLGGGRRSATPTQQRVGADASRPVGEEGQQQREGRAEADD